ncbi:hypothetical protein LSM04_000557 [Trypanosoma melophagium]|uniref:uncharacterized protein n=1 Tax=Trypanosoma melophagium TaxID=715481 RepID=UPI003519F0D1|nr:hypothetical protein LSM04_000557 [Trypanosoma melophagium]
MQYSIILLIFIVIAADADAFLPFMVASAEKIEMVPIQSEFTAHVSGDQWRRVMYRLSINGNHYSNKSIRNNSTINQYNKTNCIIGSGSRLVRDTFHCILMEALHPFVHMDPDSSTMGITSVFLTQATTPAIPVGLHLKFAVVRMIGIDSIAPNDDSLLTQLMRSDITPLQEIYRAHGGLPTDTVSMRFVQTTDLQTPHRHCVESCIWSVAIIVPLFVSTLLLLLVCISVIGTAYDAAREQQREEYLLVAYTPEAEPDEFDNCEDWGPVTLVDPDFLQKQQGEPEAYVG